MTTATEKLDAYDILFGKGIAPSTIFTADNLDVLRGMNSECIDLIYLDPPLNAAVPSNPFESEPSFPKHAWPVGLVREEWLVDIQERRPALSHVMAGARHAHSESMEAYLAYMGIRLIEMRRVLKKSGSVYLHCDPNASHYLKAAMDSIFGRENFLTEIVWQYSPSGRISRAKPANAHDVLLVYAKSYGKHTYKGQGLEHPARYGRVRSLSPDRDRGASYSHRGSVESVYERYTTAPISNVWSDIQRLRLNQREEAPGYSTQKPQALLERIISLSTNPGDVVLDPFCGCATACVAAEGMTTSKLTGDSSPTPAPRYWIGVDKSPEAYRIVLQRMKSTVSAREGGENGRILTHAGEVQNKIIVYKPEDAEGKFHRAIGGDIPERTDRGSKKPRRTARVMHRRAPTGSVTSTREDARKPTSGVRG